MRQESAAKDTGVQLAPHDERRRSQRVMLRVAVKLHVTIEGKAITIQAFTVDVNDTGALLVSPENFPAGARFTLEHAQTHQTMECRVTRKPHAIGEGFLVPAEFDNAAPGFWHVSFPPTDWKASQE